MLPVAQDAALAMQGRAREQLAKLMAKPFQPRPLTKPTWVAMPVRPPSIPAVARELAQALALAKGVAKAVGSRAQKQPGAARAESVSALTSGLKPQRMAQQAAAQYVRLALVAAPAVVMRPVAQQPEAPQRSVPAQPMSAHSAAVRDAVQVPQPAARRQ